MSLFLWIVVGIVAGWLTSQVMKDSGYGQNSEIVLGIVGAVCGGILAGLVMQVNVASGFNVETLVVALLGALTVIASSRMFKRSQTEA
jgi:uncharacterized membrane protein YeaQ/YmgE (transglycosylase-associated protein family)